MKQIINKIFKIKNNEDKDINGQTDKVLTAGELEGIRQIFLYTHQENEQNEEPDTWTIQMRKGGD